MTDQYNQTSFGTIDLSRKLETLSKTFLPQITLLNNSLSEENKLTQILSDSKNIKSVAKFIYLAFEDRKISLEVLGSIDALINSVDKYFADASDPQKKQYGIISSRDRGWYENYPFTNFLILDKEFFWGQYEIYPCQRLPQENIDVHVA